MALVLWTKKVAQHSQKNLMTHYSRSLKDSDAKTYEDQGSRGFRGDNIPTVLETNVVVANNVAVFFLLPKTTHEPKVKSNGNSFSRGDFKIP